MRTIIHTCRNKAGSTKKKPLSLLIHSPAVVDVHGEGCMVFALPNVIQWMHS